MLFAKKTQRDGAATIEFAAVSIIFLLLMFGILEYCLIIYTQQVAENAAREGARFAIVNTSDATLVTDTQAYVKSLMGGLDTKLKNYSCNVYLADANGNNIGAATSAQFGQYVCVEISIDYVPITPGLLKLSTITVHTKSSMGSEAN
jgi:Flp pilus assembly protein TadG